MQDNLGRTSSAPQKKKRATIGQTTPETADHIQQQITEGFRALNARLDRLLANAIEQETPDRIEPLLAVGDVARRLAISERTVERLIAAGKLRPLRVEGQRRFTPEAIDAYLRTHAQPRKRRAGGKR